MAWLFRSNPGDTSKPSRSPRGKSHDATPEEADSRRGSDVLPEVLFQVHIVPSTLGERPLYNKVLEPYVRSKLMHSHLTPGGKKRWEFREPGVGTIILLLIDPGSYLGVIGSQTAFVFVPQYPEYIRISFDDPPSLDINFLDVSKRPQPSSRALPPSFQAADSSSSLAASSRAQLMSTEPLPFYIEPEPPAVTPKLNVNFSELGIGGMDDQLNEILRALMSRCIKESTRRKVGLEEDTKGILLYGPPGTGKTLIASKIVDILGVPKSNYRIVNGPEILSKYVGEGEERMRQLFEPARQNPSKTFVLFFDEFDALARSRSGGDGVGQRVGDNIVNQLLSKMDGAEKIPNILVIAATNRLDIIDEALLRPGRFSVQLAIGLPDKDGRKQIFRIHLRRIAAGVLADDIDYDLLAELSKNYTGSEIKGVCHEARLFALLDAASDPTDITSVDESRLRVTMPHFHMALEKIRPAMGRDVSSKKKISNALPAHQHPLPSQQQLVQLLAKRIRSFRPGRVSSLLLTGDNGTGKSSIAAQAVDLLQTHFDTVRVISPSVQGKLLTDQLTQTWDVGKSVEKTLLVLDGLEHLIDMINEHRFNELAVKKLNALLGSQTNEPNQLFVVVVTMSSRAADMFSTMNPNAFWSARYAVRALDDEDVRVLLDAHQIPHRLETRLAGKSVGQVLDLLYAGRKEDPLEQWIENLDLFALDDMGF